MSAGKSDPHLNVLFKRDYRHALHQSPPLSPTKQRRSESESPSVQPRSSFLAALEANKIIADSRVLDDDVGSQECLELLFSRKGLDTTLFKSIGVEDGASDIDSQEYQLESQKLFSDPPEPLSPLHEIPTFFHSWIQAFSTDKIEADGLAVRVAEKGQEATEFCPHSKTECCCLQWLFQQYHELSWCLREEQEENEQLIAKNFRQGVHLKHQHEVLEHTVTLLDPSVMP
ncbi:hypothetical protein EV359DRAFT_60193 [Lentinula novae-zelandiae]|nr:hypothetical protein EV359DRAFT_60193 [Lentinula novae-zelandiae]